MVKLLLLFQKNKQTNKQTKTNAREMPGGDGHAWNWLSHYISLIAMLELWCPNNHWYNGCWRKQRWLSDRLISKASYYVTFMNKFEQITNVKLEEQTTTSVFKAKLIRLRWFYSFFGILAMKRVFIVIALVIFAPCFVLQAKELQQGNRGISNK